MRFKLIPAVCAALALFAPSLLCAQAVSDRCPALGADSARFGAQPVYRDCAVSKQAKRQKLVEPKFVSEPGVLCVVATLEFVVDATGRVRPASARVLETNSKAFATALMETLEKWRFTPAELDKQQVAQLVLVEHSMRAQDALGRTAYTVDLAGSSRSPIARPQSGMNGAPCVP